MDDEDNLEEQVQPVDVEIEEPTDEVVEEQEEAQQDFNANLAENLDDRVLTSMAQQLISDYRKDKESRGDWEKSYTSGLDLLGFKYEGEGQPFRGASSVTHPLLAESAEATTHFKRKLIKSYSRQKNYYQQKRIITCRRIITITRIITK